MGIPVASGLTTKSGIYIPEIWSGKLLVAFMATSVFPFITTNEYEEEITKHGDTVNIGTVPDLEVRPYKIGEDLQYDDPVPEKIQLVVDKGYYYGVNIDKVEEKQSKAKYVDKWAENGSYQLKKNVDTQIFSTVYADVAAENAGDLAGKESASVNLGKTGAPVELTKDNIVEKICECGQVLDEQEVPQEGRYFILPAWAATRIKASELKDASVSGDGTSIARNGRLGIIDRFTLYQSNHVASVTDGTDKAFHMLFGHKDALAFASQLVENEIIPNPKRFGKLLRGLQVFGFKTVRDYAMGDLYAVAG